VRGVDERETRESYCCLQRGGHDNSVICVPLDNIVNNTDNILFSV
jgi:hypothetical protein